jgi:tetratricopeptide (TPR) repeat protein
MLTIVRRGRLDGLRRIIVVFHTCIRRMEYIAPTVVLFALCASAVGQQDLLQFLVGGWVAVNPPGAASNFANDTRDSLSASLPKLGQTAIVRSSDWGSNIKVSGPGFECFYKVERIGSQEMSWKKQAGYDICPPATYFKRNNSEVEALVEQGNAAFRDGRPDDARAAYSEALRINPRYAPAFKRLGYLYYNAGEYAKAIAHYSDGILNAPEDAELFNLRGVTYTDKRDINHAIPDFSQAIRITNNQEPIYLGNRGLSYFSNGQYDLAVGDLEKAVQLSPENSKYYVFLGQAYYKKSNYPAAIRSFDNAISRGAKTSSTFKERGRARLGQRDYAGALKDLQQAMRLNPKDKEPVTLLDQVREEPRRIFWRQKACSRARDEVIYWLAYTTETGQLSKRDIFRLSNHSGDYYVPYIVPGTGGRLATTSSPYFFLVLLSEEQALLMGGDTDVGDPLLSPPPKPPPRSDGLPTFVSPDIPRALVFKRFAMSEGTPRPGPITQIARPTDQHTVQSTEKVWLADLTCD